MKTWQQILLGIFVGVVITSAIVLAASAPRGQAIELLPAPTQSGIVVEVSGAVHKPGVYSLSPASRVKDAIQAAGGLREDANTNALNQAAKLKDGERVHILSQAEADSLPQAVPGTRSETLPVESPGMIINLNTASLEELQTLPGIGETRAQQIIDYREANSGFKTIDEIQEVPGIGPATFERLKDQITID